MRFAAKMTLSMLVLLALFLSLNGYFMVQTNFNDGLNTVQRQCAQQQLKEKFALEKQAFAGENENGLTRQAMMQTAQAMGRLAGNENTAALYVGDTLTLYSNLPISVRKAEQILAVQQGEGVYRICEENGVRILLLATVLNIPGETYTLLNAYDVTAVFASRDSQLHTLFLLTLFSLCAALVLVSALSLLLTRPIAKLRTASEKIAQGDYAGRTQVHSNDEIGTLSESFDIMAAAIEEKVETLHDAVRQREDFVSAFTHELKTPMTSMLGYAAVLRAKEQPPETQRQAANYIYHETKRLEQLSHKLMLLMGLKNEKIELTQVSVAAVLADIKRNPPQQKNAAAVSYQPCGGKVLADRVLLEDLLRNLLINAMRACKPDGCIIVRCEKQENACVISVQDNGCGIPEKDIEKITEPFYMVDKSRSRDENGSGMGLALCSRIAQLHGTALAIESTFGKGTTVRFALKMAQEVKNEAE